MEVTNLYLTTQYITQHDDFTNGTPSNFIIYKTLCGLGATHGEALLYKRHSIILLPNTPVLIGKKTEKEEDGSLSYPEIFIVYEDVSKAELEEYLRDSTIKFKKILCTPEAYKYKVRDAIMENGTFDLYNDFFMLIDECDSLVKTVFFRGKIVSPLIDFFKFKDKSMISATPLKPSDPRFEENGFKILKVVPQFDYKKEIDIIHTNNISASLKYAIKENEDDQIFIFVNSTKLSVKLIRKLGLEKDSKVFCSEEKVRELRNKMNFRSAGSELKTLKKYNFLTSRFFSAVDIKLQIKPSVIMLTDLHRAPFSLLDPYSDCIQIVGRFRNGVNKTIHITNTNADIEFRTREDATKYIDESYECYQEIVEIKNRINTSYGVETANQAMERTDIHKFVNEDRTINYFACDSFHLHQQIKSYYRKIRLLGKAYTDTNYFIPKVLERLYDADDAFIDILEDEEISKSKLCECVGSLLLFHDNPQNNLITYVDEELYLKLRQDYPEQAKYYDKLGYAKMKTLDFNLAKMKAELNRLLKEEILNDPYLKEAIKSLYVVGDMPIKTKCKDSIEDIYSNFGYNSKVKATEIHKYYEAKSTTIDTPDGKKHAWKILSIKP
ncbi:hypothetical protein EZ456_23750 [Pedobacter psychrodurus]|uniref:Uncharacterized protein n=1 Tax=Pedobacter psychrodurus TaxID=2530456 RepID=A0A4R0PGS2_9SPHI|nr:DEAD/DEAH box helicase family protein [Pedobacter psychrodurus]TCD16966.1 hypothetical protein EZ456_23750 [Pedobacter psychrodurus]